MNELYVPEPKQHYTGVMAWSGLELRQKIRNIKPSYNTRDPQTWPLIAAEHMELIPRSAYIAMAPSRMAYTKAYVDSHILGVKRLFSPSTRMNSRMIERFLCWPLNFDRQGNIREEVGMPKADLEYWMQAVNGHHWNTAKATESIQTSESAVLKQIPQAKKATLKVAPEKLAAVTNAACSRKSFKMNQLPKLRLAVSPKATVVAAKPPITTQPKPAAHPTQPVQPVQAVSRVNDVSSTSIYDRILEALIEQQTVTSSTVVLEQQLADLKLQHQQEKDRADKAEQEITTLKAEHRTALETLQAELTHEEHIAQTYFEEKISEKKREEARKNELEIITRQAAEQKTETDKRFERIWAEMQKLKGSGGQKSKVSSGSGGGQDRRAKV